MPSSSFSSSNSMVEIILSRSSYRKGGTIVGTIRLLPQTTKLTINQRHDQKQQGKEKQQEQQYHHPRTIFEKVSLSICGYCRIDSRWHNITKYRKIQQQRRKSNDNDGDDDDDDVEYYVSNNKNNDINDTDDLITCFWSSNKVNLLNLKERIVGNWDDVKPSKQSLHVIVNNNDDERRNAVSDNDDDDDLALENKQLSFTFRLNIPNDETIPHTVLNSTTCKYYYKVIVSGKAFVIPSANTNNNNNNGLIMKEINIYESCPFIILSSLLTIQNQKQQQQQRQQCQHDDDNHLTSSKTKHRNILQAYAHSNGMPCYISPTELYQSYNNNYKRITVNQNVGLLSNSNNTCPTSLSPSPQQQVVQTLRVADQLGRPCCLLSIIGLPIIHPGSKMLLQFDFPSLSSSNNSSNSWLPCYQISACLEGEEIAIIQDVDSNNAENDNSKEEEETKSAAAAAAATSTKKKKKKKAQSFIFDTSHSYVEPYSTERISLCMTLPLDCQHYTIQTNLLEINIWCTIELTIDATTTCDGNSSSDNNNNNNTIEQQRQQKQQQKQPKYSNLRLQIPCQVVHGITANERDNDNDDDIDDHVGGNSSCCWNKNNTLENLLLNKLQRRHNNYSNNNDNDNDDNNKNYDDFFQTSDIINDLKYLSVHMIDNCKLLE